MAFNNWPYTDFHDLNLSWLLEIVRVLDTRVQVIERIINNGGGGGSAVTSVNGMTGAVVLDASDVGALPDTALVGYATQNWVRNQGYQTANDVNSAISSATNNLQTKTITDTGGYYTSDTVEGALQEIGGEIAGINTLIGSGVII